jgi:prephenate dehydrogenase
MNQQKKNIEVNPEPGTRNPEPATQSPEPKTQNPKPQIGLIGGAGVMGQWLKRFFEDRGLTVLVADLDTPQTSQEVAQEADVVILCVPIPEVAKVAREVAPHLKPDAALVDITSVKQSPMAAMLAAFPGEVVGTHPLFGPGEESINGRTVVLCPGRGERWFNWLKDLFAQAGARVKVTTATEHDRLMSVVQGLAHFVLIALGTAIRELGVSLEELEDFATPTFATLHNLTRRLVSQDARLYACIQLQNPANRKALLALEDSVADILSFIQRQNVDGLVRLIEGLR